MSEPPPDHVFEITEGTLAQASPRHAAQPRLEILGERALVPSPSAPNVLHAQAYRDLLGRMGAVTQRRNTAGVVIPDYAVRMAVLDFEHFPAGEDERAALIRFRLRKSVPFHIDESQVAYSVQIQEPERVEVLAVAIARPILLEYESLFTDAGFRVGLVTPSSIAALPLCVTGESGLTLVAKLAGSTISILVLEMKRVRLVRCLDLSTGEPETVPPIDSVRDVLRQTFAYVEDQLGKRVSKLLLCGFGGETETFGRLAEREFEVRYAAVRSR
ncbi:MAG: hypothetical protein JOZ62_16485, partial [Acidobacteriaceae bacterium]|nr:hypothetical protein [Acidobacteriaceae bacterium]